MINTPFRPPNGAGGPRRFITQSTGRASLTLVITDLSGGRAFNWEALWGLGRHDLGTGAAAGCWFAEDDRPDPAGHRSAARMRQIEKTSTANVSRSAARLSTRSLPGCAGVGLARQIGRRHAHPLPVLIIVPVGRW